MKDLRKEFESIIQEAIWQVITFDEAVEESLHVVDQQNQELRETLLSFFTDHEGDHYIETLTKLHEFILKEL